ncbi:hypothetical protein [uncultured Desulfosarcina sp.]|uniref:hypothetical protein n=1 Tax=uncultured Desulfosarcina sp. TaxID=218289 RepID=UPI0029C7748C|nr:hypothetical protein [uncultured Desulfosarcina sp.]
MDALDQFKRRLRRLWDESRLEAVDTRHGKGLRTTRENLAELFDAVIDPGGTRRKIICAMRHTK